MTRPKLITPAQGPVWLPPYTQSIERAISQAITTPGASSVSGSFTVTDLDGEKVFLILVNSLRVILPSAVGNTAKLTFKLMVPGNFTLAAASSETIDGDGTATLSAQYETVTLFSGGTDWVVLMAYQPLADVTNAIGSIGETLAQINAGIKAQADYLSQIAALSRGQSAPMPGDEPAALIAAHLNI